MSGFDHFVHLKNVSAMIRLWITKPVYVTDLEKQAAEEEVRTENQSSDPIYEIIDESLESGEGKPRTLLHRSAAYEW